MARLVTLLQPRHVAEVESGIKEKVFCENILDQV
jgi:hypothetical protein